MRVQRPVVPVRGVTDSLVFQTQEVKSAAQSVTGNVYDIWNDMIKLISNRKAGPNESHEATHAVIA